MSMPTHLALPAGAESENDLPSSLQALIDGAEAEAARALQVCNACRYCEGFCAVFPAMTRQLEFATQDVHYLANLCHNCGACLHACQYAPPHEFAINIPQTMARVRGKTIAQRGVITTEAKAKAVAATAAASPSAELSINATKSPLGASLRSYSDYLLMLLFTACFIVSAHFAGGAGGSSGASTLWRSQALDPVKGNFYSVFSHGTMATLFGLAFVWMLGAATWHTLRFWRGIHAASASRPTSCQAKDAALTKPQPATGAALEAAHNALTLKYLDGGHGDGCNEADDKFTQVRRHAHHALFYGFALCFAATSVATFYHYAFGWQAPYPYFSLPVMLGTVGGIGMVLGGTGLLVLRLKRHPDHSAPEQTRSDVAFIALLLIIAASGLLLLALRETPAMPLLLCWHLGAVLTWFVSLPYSRMMHGLYRSAALLKFNRDKRTPNPLGLAEG